MSEELDQNEEQEETGGEDQPGKGIPGTGGNAAFSVSGMYRTWFLDYASYVILERAVPALYDGLKPVQRRILHSMDDLDDGRYNKVANIIGHTMTVSYTHLRDHATELDLVCRLLIDTKTKHNT